MTNKGFSLLEMLITLFIITSLFVVGLNTFKEPNIEWIYFSNEYLLKQTDSLINKRMNYLNNTYGNSEIHFNSNGRVNRAQTINVGNKTMIIHLGTGYMTYE